jgi:predicted dehydrogenase
MNTPEQTRRDFLKAVTAAGAVSMVIPRGVDAAIQRRSIGANDRIRIGVIGCGSRGIGTEMETVAKFSQAENIEVVAVYDPWTKAREEASAKAKEWFGTAAKPCRTPEELLGLKDVDGVFISSPDHWHAAHLELAAKAGKHIYVEKPMANEIGELNRAYKVAKESGAIIQVGTQLRSTPIAMGCREFLKSGKLGKLSRIEQIRNSDKPYWYQYLKPDVKAADLDWKAFTKGYTKKPFDPILYSGWYGYWEFSQGPVPQWGVHFLDLMHFITGLGIPESCVCQGGVYTWKDEHRFTAPDQVHAVWHYPEGVMVSYTTNFGNSSGNVTRFLGDKGMLRLDWSKAVYSADGGINRDGSIRGENPIEPIEQTDHWVNWFRCMRDGKTPNANLDTGYQHSIASIMATMSYASGRRARFNAGKRTITLD